MQQIVWCTIKVLGLHVTEKIIENAHFLCPTNVVQYASTLVSRPETFCVEILPWIHYLQSHCRFSCILITYKNKTNSEASSPQANYTTERPPLVDEI
jgi:hypothetical protein